MKTRVGMFAALFAMLAVVVVVGGFATARASGDQPSYDGGVCGHKYGDHEDDCESTAPTPTQPTSPSTPVTETTVAVTPTPTVTVTPVTPTQTVTVRSPTPTVTATPPAQPPVTVGPPQATETVRPQVQVTPSGGIDTGS